MVQCGRSDNFRGYPMRLVIVAAAFIASIQSAPALADKIFAVTPSGGTEMLFPDKTRCRHRPVVSEVHRHKMDCRFERLQSGRLRSAVKCRPIDPRPDAAWEQLLNPSTSLFQVQHCEHQWRVACASRWMDGTPNGLRSNEANRFQRRVFP